jgi:hypothetical protein
MSRKPRVQRTPEEKWQIVLEGLNPTPQVGEYDRSIIRLAICTTAEEHISVKGAPSREAAGLQGLGFLPARRN